VALRPTTTMLGLLGLFNYLTIYPFKINKPFLYFYSKKTMPFNKGTSGNSIGSHIGTLSRTSKLIREHISQAIDGNKLMIVICRILEV
jgi:hypothetical protein